MNEGDIVKLKWTPCAADEASAKKMTWTDIESSDDLLEQPVTMVLYSGKVYYLQLLSYKESNPIVFGWI